MQLRADKDGFLVGEPIELKDLLKEVSTITTELAEIKELLRGRGKIAIADNSIKDLTKGIRTGVADSVAKVKPSNDGSYKQPRIQDKQRQVSTPSLERRKTDAVIKTIIKKSGSANNSLSNREIEYKPKSSTAGLKDTPLRGANGRFLKKGESSLGGYSETEKSSFGSRINKIGKNIVEGVGEIANANADQADPSLQAMGEIKNVFTPVGRGFSKIFGVGNGGVSRGQDRWYRRFFKQGEDKKRTDDIADKRQRTLLDGIYKRSGTVVKGNHGIIATLLLSFLGLLGTMLFKGIKNLMLPIALLGRLFAPLLKLLSGIAKLLGLNRVFGGIGGRDRMGSPLPAGRGRNSPISIPNGKNGKNTTGRTNQTTLGGADRASKNGGLRGLAKKLPLIGSLITAGFLANDLNDINQDDTLSKREKNGQRGSVIGSSAGSLGGFIGGASLGATIGSVVPFVGTAIGGAIGGLIGAIGGDKIGEIIGEKFGYWTDDLINSNIGQNLIYGWDVATETMRLLWGDFTLFASQKWDTFTAGLSLTWDLVASYAQSRWDAITDAFTATTGFIQSTWTTTSSLVGSTLSLVGNRMTELGKSITSTVKEYTGFDLPKHLTTLKSTVGGWVDSLKNTVKEVSSDLKNRVVGSYTALETSAQTLLSTSMIGQRIEEAKANVQEQKRVTTTAEQRKNQVMVLQALTNAGFTKEQSIALAGQVGRENDFTSNGLFGTHYDESNNALNYGMFSWQGGREKPMIEELKSKGLWKNGRMVESQESLDIQAKHAKWEIENLKRFAPTKELFAKNPHADVSVYDRTVSRNFVGWAHGQDKLKSGKIFHWRKHQAKMEKYQKLGMELFGQVIPNAGAVGFGDDYGSYENAIDPNSPEGMMKSFSAFDGMANIKMAVMNMIQGANNGQEIKKTKMRTKAVVPALNNLKNGVSVPPAPTVQTPISSGQSADSNANLDDVGREVSDRRIAHIVTGAYSKN